jgi:hypothetical protein
MPGKQVKNWKQYEALREEGFSKEQAARITNASERSRTRSKKSKKRQRRKVNHGLHISTSDA